MALLLQVILLALTLAWLHLLIGREVSWVGQTYGREGDLQQTPSRLRWSLVGALLTTTLFGVFVSGYAARFQSDWALTPNVVTVVISGIVGVFITTCLPLTKSLPTANTLLRYVSVACVTVQLLVLQMVWLL
jgi:hypothetical protein